MEFKQRSKKIDYTPGVWTEWILPGRRTNDISAPPPHPTPHPHPRLQEKSWKVRKVRKQLERYRWRVAECWSFLMLGDGDMRFYFSALFIFNIFDISIFLNKVFFKRVDCKYELEGPNRRWLCARGKCKCYFQNLKMAREPSISLGLLRLSLQARLA